MKDSNVVEKNELEELVYHYANQNVVVGYAAERISQEHGSWIGGYAEETVSEGLLL